jgi:hypothetical protein
MISSIPLVSLPILKPDHRMYCGAARREFEV